MSVLSKLKGLGGCAGGKVIYFAAKATVEVANVFKKKKRLKAATKTKMKRLFPKLNLDRVRFREGCSLPGNWFTSAKNVRAMTFGYTIYFKSKNIEGSKATLNVLMHELVHVDQVRRRGNSEDRFACDYGKGFLTGKGYRQNPLETEAFDFVTENAF